jgi:DNA-binding NarL/FixJ family response regulator
MTNKLNVYNALRTNVLDDDKDMNELLKEMFDMSGFHNTEFFDDSQLFVDALNENIHLCIIDQNIKLSSRNLQGINVAHIVKERFPKCRIIFVTGSNDPMLLKELIRLKPDGFVHKDEPNYLNKVIEESLKQLAYIKQNFEFANILSKYKTEDAR